MRKWIVIMILFFENAGELCFFVLRKRK